MARNWERIKQIQSAYKRLGSCYAVADEIGISHQAVNVVLRREGIDGKDYRAWRKTKADCLRDAVIESYKSTYNISRTAAELEVSASFVRTILSQAGFETGMSEAKYRHRFQSYVDRSGGKESCWLWTAHSKTPQGYGWMMYRGRPRRSYWLAWIFAGRPLPTNGLWILHSCGINLCCNPAHLREGTPKDNAQDREMHAKQRGVRIHPRQIPVEFDQKILDGLKQGKSVGRIAKELQITQPTVWRIKKRFENQTSPVF